MGTLLLKSQTNFAYGEVGPEAQGRVDIDGVGKIYGTSVAYMENFLSIEQGPFMRRPGFLFLLALRGFNYGRTIPFAFSDTQAYLLSFTHGKLRIIRNDDYVKEASKSISAVSLAANVTVTSTAHGYSNGDEILITGTVGSVELNDKYYLVSDVTTDTFKLKTLMGVYVNGTGFGTYTSGGTAAKVYELRSPYAEADVDNIQFTENADVMYLTCSGYAPYKLTRVSGDSSWTLKSFTRTTDPFYDAAKTVSAITKGNPGVVTSTGHGYANGDVVSIHSCTGMVELNDFTYVVAGVTTDTFTLKYQGTNVVVDSTAFGTYTGTAGRVYKVKTDEQPVSVAFDTGRIWYGGSVKYPDKFWGSKGPKDDGTMQYEDFSVSTPIVASDAVVKFIPNSGSSQGKVDAIRWISSTKDFLVIGTFGAVYRITGPTLDDPIVPDDTITIKKISTFGASTTPPVFLGETLFYTQRNNLRLRSMAYSVLQNDYGAEDRNLVAPRIAGLGASAGPGFAKMAAQVGLPDCVWVCRRDGRIAGLSFKGPTDIIEGWHRHRTKGSIVDIVTLPRADGYDDYYITVAREVQGQTRHYYEKLSNTLVLPLVEDMLEDEVSSESIAEVTTDRDAYAWEVNKNAVYVDSALSYDGTQDCAITITQTEEGTFTVSSVSVSAFTASDIDREIWLKYKEDGTGGGRLVIREVVSNSVVKCIDRESIGAVTSCAAGDWRLTASRVRGLEHLEGHLVDVVTDGAFHGRRTVTNGTIELDQGSQASVITVGLRYISVCKSHNLNVDTKSGSTNTLPRKVSKIKIDTLESGAFKIGTSLAYLADVLVPGKRVNNRVALPSTGVREVRVDDETSLEKNIFVVQDEPYPLTVRGLYMEVDANV